MMPILVRQTAINAHRSIRNVAEGWEKPYFTRAKLIQEIQVKNTDPDQSINHIFGKFIK